MLQDTGRIAGIKLAIVDLRAVNSLATTGADLDVLSCVLCTFVIMLGMPAEVVMIVWATVCSWG